MNAQTLLALSAATGALGIALWALVMLWQSRRIDRASRRVGQALQARPPAARVEPTLADAPRMASAQAAQAGPGAGLNMRRDSQLLNPLVMAGQGSNGAAAQTPQELAARLQPPAWLQSGFAKALLADEDRRLLDQAGISLRDGSTWYILSRALLALALPVLAILLLQPQGLKLLMVGFFGFGLGLMAPKWYVRARAAKRRQQVVEELPLFVDLLRLLQGVGLSIDQSLQILATEFGSVLRILSGELMLANQLYASGRSREASFQRLTHLSADDDMAAVVGLLVQVDRHGGAVQEPLAQFSVRLREKRQASFKEKIGKITVKMTGVMVLTLLPALLVITAGPGFLAVIRSLSSMGGNG